LGEGERTERIWGELVSGNFFDALGVRPRLGRFFLASDRPDEPGATPVVVISEAVWRRKFKADPGVLGRTVKLNQQDFTIVGVAPATFPGSLNGLAFDVWVPVALHARLMGPSRWLEDRNWRALHTLGRLAPGATLESARAELAAIAGQLSAAHPKTNQRISLVALPIASSPHGAHRLLAQPLLLLLGVCGLLLLIVCANLANLLLVRASARQREMCIRQALGAGWLRLVRQSLAESLMLSAVGTLAGLMLTLWLSDVLRLFIPDATLPIALTAHISGGVLSAAIALSVSTALLAGLVPALWAARPNLMGALRTQGRGAALTPRAELFRSTLVIAQVALALVTLACAALAAKSFREARRAHPGFDAQGVLLAAVKLDASGYSRDAGAAFLERLQQALATLPGVDSSALAENVPLGLSGGSWEEVRVPGYTPAPQENLRVYRNLVSSGYFSLMRIPLLDGREFTDADRRDTPAVAIVNETFARRYFGTANAVGRTFSIWGGRRTLSVVGIARDIKVRSLGEAALPYYYVPLRQAFLPDTGIAVHLRVTTGADPIALLPSLRATVRALDPNVPIFEALTLSEYTSAARFAQKAAASVLAVLSAIALALTALGLYGVLAFAVAQRTPEIGVRLALGARSIDIARLVLARGAWLIAFGLGAGLLAAIGVSRFIAALLYGVNAFEPTLLAAATVPVVLAAFAACWLPARRATKVDPIVALRAE
jgi:predicted permease